MPFETKEFDEKSWQKTHDSWLSDLDTTQAVSPVEVYKALEFAKENAIYNDETKETVAYGIFEGRKTIASAIANLIVSRTGRRFLKVLDVNVRPSIEDGANTENIKDSNTVIELYVTAIIGAIELTPKHRASVVKVYGRSASFMQVLKFVATEMPKRAAAGGANFKVSIEGRWLVIKF
ncbi:hypothetical protein [Herbaspirillum autotrophicum]|uniref:hypothetical protein n=1 Tax=Herbaspirillum autotrophicum TaxID=180195 RepID=UPI00067B4FE7|nr:hypothetical protein [Herbaspirillum autotrophicum]